MPGSPDNSEHQCRPEGIETTLQPRKRETAPAHLLKQSNDDDRREQSYTDPQPICVGPTFGAGAPVATVSAAATAAKPKGLLILPRGAPSHAADLCGLVTAMWLRIRR